MSHEEMNFCELKNKEIINEVDGRRLGKTCDLIFSLNDGCVLGIVAPYNRRGLFFKGQEVYIPFKHIIKIGPDVILVRLSPELSQPDDCVNMGRGHRKNGPPRYGGHHGAGNHSGEYHNEPHMGAYQQYDHDDDRHQASQLNVDSPPPGTAASPDSCDFRCEKCMLFDCNKRWKGGVRSGGSAYVDGKPYR